MAHIDMQILLAKAARIRLFISDVDGVLTDGSIVYNAKGEQIHAFNVQDGFGLKLLKRAGIEVALISSRTSMAVEKRAMELSIERVFQGRTEKMTVYKTILAELGIKDEDAAYIGDDWADLPLLKRVGLSVAVSDAAYPLHDHVDYVTQRGGGKGAVREVCDLILKAQNKWGVFLNEDLNLGSDLG
ncbi:MAG: KdsC family phosphatase [Dissulfurimicrobium sp.]|uniref:KdsC family phosphatase n=1 Tax=Dissulfurimicrobium TaxID=1769732 RepID=UPI001EDA9CE2|nr:HAD-IIIA family hydrolase [Dissulfurimicrobium hydrothermale]UKL13516.1 HAD-IIIA family hydrolase [Dissulfurimicrobium hydrothermale]